MRHPGRREARAARLVCWVTMRPLKRWQAPPDMHRFALALLCALAAPAAVLAAERPHILYVTVDDLGWKDVGYHGSSIRTPALDRLAKEGARLEDFYVQPYS